MSFKDAVFELLSKNYTKKQIGEKLNCSYHKIRYHTESDYKITTAGYRAKQKARHPYMSKVYSFCKKEPLIKLHDLINKLGEQPKCYYTGINIDIYDTKSYQFDHLIPRSRGGKSDINNLVIATKKANQAKNDLTESEFLQLCKDILIYKGIIV